MGVEVIKKLNIDFYNTKYISVNAKQYDRASRFILITCHNQGTVFPLNSTSHFAYIRYKKTDDLKVFNSCVITAEGQILVELSEQMLAVVGKSYADLVILYKKPKGANDKDDINDIKEAYSISSTDDGNGTVTATYSPEYIDITDDDNGTVSMKMLNIDDAIVSDDYSILSTMMFCINVFENAFDNTEIESTYEYNALNDLLIKSTEDYNSVVTMCNIYETSAGYYADNAKESEINSKASEENSKISEINSKDSEEKALTSAASAKISETNSKTYEENALFYETKAEADAVESSKNALLSQSYAVGGTDSRVSEDTDNAKYYYSQIKVINDNINGKFSLMGTIEFSELATVTKETGYVYHIKDAFVTDATFKEGAGISYPIGTNVYYTTDGYWACFVGRIATTDDFDILYKTVENLQKRIEELEAQNVLGINE